MHGNVNVSFTILGSSGIQKEVFIPLEKNSYVKHLHKIKAESAQDDPHSQLHDFDDFSEQDCDWDSNSAEEPPKLKVKVEQAIEVGNHLVKEEARPFRYLITNLDFPLTKFGRFQIFSIN